MDTLLANLPYPTVKIEDNVDCVVDLEARPNCLNVVERWYNEMNKRIVICTQQDNEKLVDDEMLFYYRTLKEKIISNKDKQSLANKILLHIKYFYLYYKENIHGIADTNYFKGMEDILVYYCNLELDLVYISSKQRVNMKYLYIIKRLCKVLGIYLHHKLKNIIHVLLRMSYNTQNTTCQMVMRQIFSHFLMSLPQEPFSEEVFCRYYLVFERYKEVAKPEEKQKLLQYMFRKFNKTEDYLTKSGLMRTVLSTSSDSIPDIVTHLLDSKTMAIQKYFDYLANVQNDEITRLITNFNAQCVTNGYTNSSHELMNTMLQSEPLCIDSDSDVEALEYQDTIVLSEDEEGMEITYRKKDVKPKRKSKIENNGGVINLDSDEEPEISVVLDETSSSILKVTPGSSRTTVPTTVVISDSDTASTSTTTLESSVVSVSVSTEVTETSAPIPPIEVETTLAQRVPKSVLKEVESKTTESSNSSQALQSVAASPSLSQSRANKTTELITSLDISTSPSCLSLLDDEDVEFNTKTDNDSSLKEIGKCTTDETTSSTPALNAGLPPPVNTVKPCENSPVKMDVHCEHNPNIAKDVISTEEKTRSILQSDYTMNDVRIPKSGKSNLVSASENNSSLEKGPLLQKPTLSEPGSILQSDYTMDDACMPKLVKSNLVSDSETNSSLEKRPLLQKQTLSKPGSSLQSHYTMLDSYIPKSVKSNLVSASENNSSLEKSLLLQKPTLSEPGSILQSDYTMEDACMPKSVKSNLVSASEANTSLEKSPLLQKPMLSEPESILQSDYTMDDTCMPKSVKPSLVSASETNSSLEKSPLLQKLTLSEPGSILQSDYTMEDACMPKSVKSNMVSASEANTSLEKSPLLQKPMLSEPESILQSDYTMDDTCMPKSVKPSLVSASETNSSLEKSPLLQKLTLSEPGSILQSDYTMEDACMPKSVKSNLVFASEANTSLEKSPLLQKPMLSEPGSILQSDYTMEDDCIPKSVKPSIVSASETNSSLEKSPLLQKPTLSEPGSILQSDYTMEDACMPKSVKSNLVSASEANTSLEKSPLLQKHMLSEPGSILQSDYTMKDDCIPKSVKPSLVSASETNSSLEKSPLLQKPTLSEPGSILQCDYTIDDACMPKSVQPSLVSSSETNTSLEKSPPLQKPTLSEPGSILQSDYTMNDACMPKLVESNLVSASETNSSLEKSPLLQKPTLSEPESILQSDYTMDDACMPKLVKSNLVSASETNSSLEKRPLLQKQTLSEPGSSLQSDYTMIDSYIPKSVKSNLVSASENNSSLERSLLWQKPTTQSDDGMTTSVCKEVKCDIVYTPASDPSSERETKLQICLSERQKEETLKEVTTNLVEYKRKNPSPAICSLTERINKDNSSMDFKVTVGREFLEVTTDGSNEPKTSHVTPPVSKPSLSIRIPLPTNVVLPPQSTTLFANNSDKCNNLEKVVAFAKEQTLPKPEVCDNVLLDLPKDTLPISEPENENIRSRISAPQTQDTSEETTNKLCDSTSRMALTCSVSKHLNQDESRTDLRTETSTILELEAKSESGFDDKRIEDCISNEQEIDNLKLPTLTNRKPTSSGKKISKNVSPKVRKSAYSKRDTLEGVTSLSQKTPDLKVQLNSDAIELNKSQPIQYTNENDAIISKNNRSSEKDSNLLAVGSYTGDIALSRSRNKLCNNAVPITKNDSSRNYDGKAGNYLSTKPTVDQFADNRDPSTAVTIASQNRHSKSAIVDNNSLKSVLPSVQLKCSLPLSLSSETNSSLHTFPPSTRDATKIRIQFRDGKLISTSLNSSSEQSGEDMTFEKLESEKNMQLPKNNDIVKLDSTQTDVVNSHLPSHKTSIKSSSSHNQRTQSVSVLDKTLPIVMQSKDTAVCYEAQDKIPNGTMTINKPFSQENIEPLLLPIDVSKSADIILAHTLPPNAVSSTQTLIPSSQAENSATTSKDSVIPPLQLSMSVSDPSICQNKSLAVATTSTLLQVLGSVESQPPIITQAIYKYSEFSPLQSPIPTYNSDKSQHSPPNVNLGLITPSTDSQSDGNPRYLEDFSDDDRLPNVDFLNKISSSDDTNFKHFRKEIGGPFSEIDADDHINDYIDTGQIDIEDTIVQASVPTSKSRDFIRHVSQDNECHQKAKVCDIRDTLPKTTFEDRKAKKLKKALRNKHSEQTEAINHTQNIVCTNTKLDFSEEFSSIFSGPVKSQFKNGQYYENGNPDLFNIADSVPPVHKITKRANSGDSRKGGVKFGVVEIREIEPKKRKRNSYQKVSTIPKVTKGNGSDLLNKNSVTNHNTSSSVILHKIHFSERDDRTTLNSSPGKGSSSRNDLHENKRKTSMQGNRTVLNGGISSWRPGKSEKRFSSEEYLPRKRR